MTEFKINGVSLEFDVYELDNAKKYQEELNKVVEIAEKAKNEKNVVECIKMQCTAIFAFIDNLFGEGKHKEIFGKSTNLKKCVSVFAEITQKIPDMSEIDDIIPKTKPQRSKKK